MRYRVVVNLPMCKISIIKYLKTTKCSTTKLKTFSWMHLVIGETPLSASILLSTEMSWSEGILYSLVLYLGPAYPTEFSWCLMYRMFLVNHCTITTGTWSLCSTVSHRITESQSQPGMDFKGQSCLAVNWMFLFPWISSVLHIGMLFLRLFIYSIQLRH